MKYFIFSILLIFMVACNQNENSDKVGKTIVSGEIVNPSDDFIVYNINRRIQYGSDTAFLQNGKFNIVFKIDEPTYVDLNVNNEEFSVYLKPDDSLYFALDAENLYKSIRYKNKSLLVYNHYLIDFAKFKNNFSSKLAKVFTLNEDKAVMVLDSLKRVQTKNVSNLKLAHRAIDEKFLKTEKARIKYHWAYNLNVFERYHRYLSKDSDFEVSADFDSYLSELNINDSTLLELDIYRLFLSNYFNGIISELYSNEITRYENPSYFVFRMSKIGEIFRDKYVREFMAYSIMLDHIKSQGYKDYDKVENIFKRHCKSEHYLNRIEKELKKRSHLKEGNPAKDFATVNLNNDTVRLSDFKGKYIYLDIWATWCTPCLYEIPYLEELQHKFRNNEILFISVSVDARKDKWEQMVKNRNLTGIQLYAGKNNVIKDFYKVSKIPRFMLLDKNMNFISSSAERPSMGVDELISELEGI